MCVCVVLCASMCVCVPEYLPQSVWTSEDKLGSCFLPSTLFDAGSVVTHAELNVPGCLSCCSLLDVIQKFRY